MKKYIAIVTAALLVSTIWTSCRKPEEDVDIPDPDNEVITTVRLEAVNAADTTDKVTAEWRDLTPNDGNPDLSKANMTLKKDAVYNVSLTFLDETKTPAGDITEEVRDRANYHLVCYAPATGLNLGVVRTDKDNNTPQMELGLQSKFTTGAVSTGNLQVALHHQPSGKNGTDCSIGSTDAEVNFAITVQ
ncbi:hypothetical protein GCM10023093_31790 [Nemorincola caseinilytica]|uniref:Type 1 periplasmic binding fold superfamily protein n=1 Tax=Nemorincola caseinilytica TaxID=2054315 RepID=A0ABP8NS75_9BACT